MPISTTVLTHAYTLVFTRELPDTRAVRQVKRTLRELFETDEVTTSDSRKFSFVTTIREERIQVAVDLFGRDQRRKFVAEGGQIHELNYQAPSPREQTFLRIEPRKIEHLNSETPARLSETTS